ncbi:MAG: primosome assembly protein PriA [Actinomycetales bacterium]|uniref:Probable replication restart protein PriA n=1 Tax=Candidatus Phosphoribacter hodrii TaxID=2953743 RepID=A0A9D7Y038_9MICO|nr:primosome assembly protein PriA [Candidatus Phosphoribacter hodrii]
MPIDDAPSPLPVAAVVVDSGLAHLDRPFEYAVPPELDAAAQPGVRVRVRFAGRDLDGFVVARRAKAEHPGRLTPIRRVVSPEPVLTPQIHALTRAVADRYGGVLGDVLRLAIPKRHATAERALPLDPPVPSPTEPSRTEKPTRAEAGPWAAYPAGEAFLRRVAAGGAPGAAWLAIPGRAPEQDWPRAFAEAAAAALSAGRGAVIVVPDHRDVVRVDEALTAVLGAGRHVRLTADQGPQARYTAWLKLLRGHVRVVVGTRTAAFAPVRDLGLVAWWDDGDDLLAEPRAPYPQVRTVLAIRAEQSAAALLVGGFGRSVQVQRWVAAGRVVDLRPTPATLRAAAARVVVAGEGEVGRERDSAAASAQLPPSAWRIVHEGLTRGPVLVQVPRGGYRPSLSCQVCRAPVRCTACHGPMGQDDPRHPPACTWCGTGFGIAGFRCPQCDSTAWRAAILGSRRTAEELGRAFPGVPVITSASGQVAGQVAATPALVIATPGAEPRATQGYAACLLLDAWATLSRPELDAPVEALRRWLAAAALCRSALDGGVVVLAGVPDGPPFPAVEALVRWDPVWLAERELTERAELGLPPAVVMAELVGTRHAVAAAVSDIVSGADLDVTTFGPLPVAVSVSASASVAAPVAAPVAASASSAADAPHVRMVLRVPHAQAGTLARALAATKAIRSARKDPEPLHVRMGWTGEGSR